MCQYFYILDYVIVFTCSETVPLITYIKKSSWDSSISVVMGCGLGDRGLIPGRAGDFPLLHSIQTGSGAHPASYPVGTGGSFPGGEVAGA
jgi:hypothetical protein